MNEGWLHYDARHVILRIGLDEYIGIITRRYDDRAVVLVRPANGYDYSVAFPLSELRDATPLEIYEHGEARLKTQLLGPSYGTNARVTMWDLMTRRDVEYWQGLRPEESEMR